MVLAVQSLQPQKPQGSTFCFYQKSWKKLVETDSNASSSTCLHCITVLEGLLYPDNLIRIGATMHSPLEDGSQQLIPFSGTQKGYHWETEVTAESEDAGGTTAKSSL